MKNLAWAQLSVCRHAPLCFSQPLKMYEMSKAIERTIINRHAFLFKFRSTRCFWGEACSDFTHRLPTLYRPLATPHHLREFTHRHFWRRSAAIPAQWPFRCRVWGMLFFCWLEKWSHSLHVWSSKKKKKGWGGWGGWCFALRWHTHQILRWWVSSHWSTAWDKAARWGCADCQAVRLNCIHRSCSLEGAL